jgi:hypothetical protein
MSFASGVMEGLGGSPMRVEAFLFAGTTVEGDALEEEVVDLDTCVDA